MSEDRSSDQRFHDHQFRLRWVLCTLSVVLLVPLAACGQMLTATPAQSSPTTTTPTAPPATQEHRPTATALHLPPPDTATPTITPTPIVHIVQQGDTLHAIAFDFGVRAEAIQRVNGIENPQLLQVGQRLVIPVGDEKQETASNLLLPTPTPQPIEVRGMAFYNTRVGSLSGLGEVVNTTGITLTNVLLDVTLFNAAGESVAEIDEFAAADLIPPGASSPFGILFTTPPSAWASYQVTVTRAQDAGALAGAYVAITAEEVDGRPAGSQFQVSGVIQNDSKHLIAESVEIIVTTYDARGSVTGFRQETMNFEEGLAAGKKTAFDLWLTSHGDAPVDFNVIALGRATDR